MIYKTHMAFAVTPALIIESALDYINIYNELLLYLAVAIGSLLPDLDENGSKLSKSFPIFPIVYELLGIRHRGVTHYLLFSFVFVTLSFFILQINNADIYNNIIFYGLSYGYFMHLIGDMLTKGGINNFYYPLINCKGVILPKKFRFYTHSIEEFIFLYFLSTLVVLQIIYRLVSL